MANITTLLNGASCTNLTLTNAEFKIQADGSLKTVYSNELDFNASNYILNGNKSFLCFPYSSRLQSCLLRELNEEMYKFEENSYNVVSLLSERTYAVGNYVLVNNSLYVCSHRFTSFEEFEYKLQSWCWMLSTVALLVTVVIRVLLKPRTTEEKAFLCHAVSFFFVALFLSVPYTIEESAASNKTLCYIIATGQQFTFIAAFTWLNVVAFDMWRRFVPNRFLANCNGDKRWMSFFWMSLYGWGIPAIFVCVGLILDKAKASKRPYYSIYCRIIGHEMMLLLLYGPLGFILALNVIFFSLTVLNLRKICRDVAEVNRRSQTRMFQIYAKLMLIMGVNWTMEVISFLVRVDNKYWIVFDTFNALQGFIFFLIYCCNKPVLSALKNHYRCLRKKQGLVLFHNHTESVNMFSTVNLKRRLSERLMRLTSVKD